MHFSGFFFGWFDICLYLCSVIIVQAMGKSIVKKQITTNNTQKVKSNFSFMTISKEELDKRRIPVYSYLL